MEDRYVPLSKYPLCGRIIEAHAIERYTGSTITINESEPSALLLIFEDGHRVIIRPTGWESDGLAIETKDV